MQRSWGDCLLFTSSSVISVGPDPSTQLLLSESIGWIVYTLIRHELLEARTLLFVFVSLVPHTMLVV